MGPREQNEASERREELIAALASTHGGYLRAAQHLRNARQLFHEQVAIQVAPLLNKYLEKVPKSTLQEKQELAKWVNAELRSLGLAVRCPKTGQAAMLRADPGHDEEHGRFQIALISNDLARKRTVSSPELFQLDLMANFERREPLAERWRR